MRETDLMSPSKVAEAYGGDKRKIGQAVQMGLIDPTVGVMAGMFIDRMRAAAAKEQQPDITVAQEVLSPAAAPVERGLDALPVPEDAVPSEYAGGGIVAFDNGGSTSPFMRDVQEFGERGRRSVAERTPGMVGAYRNAPPLVSPEEEERMNLRKIIEQKYGPYGSLIQGYFTNQSPGQRQAAKDVLSRIGTMSIDEMRTLAGTSTPVSAGLTAIAPPAPGATMADLVKTVPGDMALRSAPGKTAQQSAEDVAAARAPATAPAARQETQETVMSARRPDIAPASFEDALAKAKTAMGALPSDDPYADIKAELAERKGKADESLKNAAWMRLAEAGLGMMAGTSPYAAVNIGKAAVQSIKNYGEDLKDQKKLDREDRKLLADIKRLEQSEKRDNVFKTTELAYRILNEANEDVRARLQSDTQLQAASMQAGATRERTAFERENLVFQRAMTLANTAEQNVRTSLARQAENPLSPVAKAIKANPNYIEEQAVAARNRILKDSGLSVPSMTEAQTSGGGRTVDFSSLPR